MKTKRMVRLTKVVYTILLLVSCTRNKSQCNEVLPVDPGFTINEFVLDTAMQTDTAFSNRDIVFKTNDNYADIIWKIGDDPRQFTNSTVLLRFVTPGNINIVLTGERLKNSCSYEEFKRSGSLELVADNGTVKSPLIGEFQGFNTDTPSDTFTVAIRNWTGPRYPWWPAGAYSIDNLPRGYADSTQNFNGESRPEIKGIIATTGYKNMAFDKSGIIPAAGIKGYAFLRRGMPDTLIANYSIIDTAHFNQTGILIFIRKKFIGIKK